MDTTKSHNDIYKNIKEIIDELTNLSYNVDYDQSIIETIKKAIQINKDIIATSNINDKTIRKKIEKYTKTHSRLLTNCRVSINDIEQIIFILENVATIYYIYTSEHIKNNLSNVIAFNDKYYNLIIFKYNNRYYILSVSSNESKRNKHLKSFYDNYNYCLRNDDKYILLDPLSDNEYVNNDSINIVSNLLTGNLEKLLDNSDIVTSGLVTLSSIGKLLQKYLSNELEFDENNRIKFNDIVFENIYIMKESYDKYVKHLSTIEGENLMLALQEMINMNYLTIHNTSLADLVNDPDFINFNKIIYSNTIDIDSVCDSTNNHVYMFAKYYKYYVLDVTNKIYKFHVQRYDTFVNHLNIN